MKRLLIAGLAAAAIALGACGDDEGEETTATTEEAATGAPQATQSLDDAVAQLNEAIASDDCEAMTSLAFSFLRSNAAGDAPAEPGEPVRPEECEKGSPADLLLTDIEGTTFDESEDFGAAAVSMGSGGKAVQGYDEWSVIWLVDRDGQWRTHSFFPADPQFDEDLPETVDPVATTEEAVAAIQAGDCSNADELFGEQTRLGKTSDEACENLAGGSIFAPAVAGATDITYEEIGATRDYAVVGIDTGDTYFAALLGTPVIDAKQPVQDVVHVLDVVPLTDFEIAEAEEPKES